MKKLVAIVLMTLLSCAAAEDEYYRKAETALATFNTVRQEILAKLDKREQRSAGRSFHQNMRKDFKAFVADLEELRLIGRDVLTNEQFEKRLHETIAATKDDGAAVMAEFNALKAKAPTVAGAEWQEMIGTIAEHSRRFGMAKAGFDARRRRLKQVNIEALRRAAAARSIPVPAEGFAAMEEQIKALLAHIDQLDDTPIGNRARLPELDKKIDAAVALQRTVAIEKNPAVDFDEILLIRRRAVGGLGLPTNWRGNSGGGCDNEIARMSLDTGEIRTVVKTEGREFIGDIDLHFDAQRMIFSLGHTVTEAKIDGSGLRKVITDVDSDDPCYLPDGRIIFSSANICQGVPCVGGRDAVGNLHIANADGSGIRRLCFDQDHNWHPCVMPDGRVMYTRWEYTDSAHYFSRVLMTMNPDGSGQMGFYGSNSYWPNSIFYARPLPGSTTKFVAVVSGHHGVRRAGELILFDVAKGTHEADGVIQRIPGWGEKVEPVIRDGLVNQSWPRFVQPYPLSHDSFLVACQPDAAAEWGIYLVDIYDNIVPIRILPGYALFEPVPIKKRPMPPAIPDRINLEKKTATVYLSDIYRGQGLDGVPRGAVKQLRVFQYEYAYRHTGGHYVIGFEGPWDVRRLLGTVPVYEDGSTSFEIPANVPLALQPLDSEGKALAQMRSWFVGMPGENVACVGCHEKRAMSPPSQDALAYTRTPLEIKPWYGPKRGFSFRREVQPVLDKSCIGCHSGTEDRPDFRDGGLVDAKGQSRYSNAYLNLHPFVRRNGPEGDYHVLTPLEFHADTSELVQILQKGHHGVRLDDEAWDRLITWIDLNVPFHGTWNEASNVRGNYVKERFENRKIYANVIEDIEAVLNPYVEKAAYVPPATKPGPTPAPPELDGWPFDAPAAKAMQGDNTEFVLQVADGLKINFVRIPPGRFVMGDRAGFADEKPKPVTIDKPFWIAKFEITARQFQQFDPKHDNGVYDMHYKDQVDRGYYVNDPKLPVIRVSWARAMEFCTWLSGKTGRTVTLPTEEQWEWAARAGTATPLPWGEVSASFGKQANLADLTIKELAVRGVNPKPIKNPPPTWAYVPADYGSDDGVLHLAEPGRYVPNAWGLHDMHGNVAEWTLSSYDGIGEEKVVRGGSWRDRPKRAASHFRLGFPHWQRVFNVGFRIVINE